jgi:putative ABC transport system permease protein
MMKSQLQLVVRNMLRNRRRTTLTIGSMAVSLCLVGVLLALSRALFYGGETTPAQAKRLIVHHKIALTQDLPVGDEQAIEKIPGVGAVTRLRWFGGTYKDPRNPNNRFGQFAVEPAALFKVHPEFRIAKKEEEAFIAEKTACVASRALAQKLGWKPSERITLVNRTLPATLELTLVGIFDAPSGDNSSVLYFNWDYLRDSLLPGDPRRDMVQQFHVESASEDSVSDVASGIDATFENSPYPTKSEPEQAFLLTFVSFLGNLKLFLAAISGAVIFTMLLISMNMISMSVRERTQEVGILKTLGFSTEEILAMFVSEATLIVLIGGLIGCALAAGVCAAIANAMKGAPGFLSAVSALHFSSTVVLLTLAVSLLIGLMSSLVPALIAARVSIVEALQYNG